MCSHIVGLLKQLFHYVIMKLQSVSAYLTCTRMQQSWHKPCRTEIQAAPVMNVLFSKEKWSEAKGDPVMCSEAGEKNEVKACNAYCSKISFVVCVHLGWLLTHP